MATLTGNTIASTYTGILSVSGAVGTDTVEAVTDGAGTSTSLSLSQQRATITLGSGAGDDFIVDGTTLVVEGDNNRVGIGNSIPLSTLHVDGGVNAIAPSSGTTSNAITRLELTGTDIGLDIGATSTGTNRAWLQARGDTTDDLSSTAALTLNEAGGYVGINYGGPIFPLHMQASGNISRGVIADETTAIAYENAIGIAGNSSALTTTAVIQLGDNDDTNSRQWAISNGWYADGSGFGQQHAGNLFITVSSGVNKDPLSALNPGTTTFAFNRDNYFGVGTHDPSTNIHIKHDSGAKIRLEGDSTYFDFYKVDGTEKMQIESDSGFVHVCCDGANSRVGIGTSSPDYLLDVENASGHSKVRIHAGDDSSAQLLLENDQQIWNINCQTSDKFAIYDDTDDTERLVIDTNGKIGIGDSAPNAMLTINAQADENFLTLKAENIASGLTSVGETDDIFIIKEAADNTGGVEIIAISDTARLPMRLKAYGQTAAQTGEATDQGGEFYFNSYLHNGSNTVSAQAADGNIFTVGNNGDVQFIVKGNGELYANTAGTTSAASISTFDEYNDAHLVRAIDITKKGRGFIDNEFDKFVEYNDEKLKELRLIGQDEEGNTTGFVSLTGMQKLHNGAIWQQYTEMQKMKELMYDTMVELLGKEKANAKLQQHEVNLLKKDLLN